MFLLSIMLMSSIVGHAQEKKADVFVPIVKYIQRGEADNLAAWFAKKMEIEIFGERTECSKPQAERIMKVFFDGYQPKSFEIIHKSGNSMMKYAIGTLTASGETFRVLLLVKLNSDSPVLLRIKIERAQI